MADYNLANLRYAAVKVESTPGTMETPASADFKYRLRDLEITPEIEFDDEASKVATGDHAEDIAIAGVRAASLSFYVKGAWGGAVNTAPNWWDLAKMCGAGEIAYGSTGVALVGRKAYDKVTHTIWVVDVERKASGAVHTAYQFAGCMGNMLLLAEGIGKPWLARFNIRGKFIDVDEISALDMTSPDTTKPEVALNNTFTIGGNTRCISQFQFDTGNDVQPVYCTGEETGISHFGIVSRRPRFSCNPLSTKQSDYDVFDDVINETTQVVSNASTNFTLKILKAQTMNPALAAREGLVNWNLNLRALKNGTTGSLVDSDLTPEDTWELLQGSRT